MKIYTSMHKKVTTKNFDTITTARDKFTSQKVCPVCGIHTEDHHPSVSHTCLHCGCEHIFKK